MANVITSRSGQLLGIRALPSGKSVCASGGVALSGRMDVHVSYDNLSRGTMMKALSQSCNAHA